MCLASLVYKGSDSSSCLPSHEEHQGGHVTEECGEATWRSGLRWELVKRSLGRKALPDDSYPLHWITPDFQNFQPAAQMLKIRNRLSLHTVRIADPQNTKIKCFKSLPREWFILLEWSSQTHLITISYISTLFIIIFVICHLRFSTVVCNQRPKVNCKISFFSYKNEVWR